MKELWFDLELKSTSSCDQVLEEINKVLNLQMKPSECDWYDGGPVWEACVLGMQIELHHFPEDNDYCLSGNLSEEFRSMIDSESTEINDISEAIANMFQTHFPQTPWRSSLCLDCIALTESIKLYQSTPFHPQEDEIDAGF